MRPLAPLAIVSALFAAPALAQLVTTTLPWADGNTLVISVGTNAAGVIVTSTVSTIGATAVTGALTTPTTNTRTTTTRRGTTTTAGPVTTTGQRVVGVDTTAPPMRTTTYWYDPGDGVWVSDVWTASVTAAPTVATAIVPEGSIQDYNQYQSTVNSVVLASAENAAASVSGKTGAAMRRVGERDVGSMAGWIGMAIGAIGAGVGVLGL